MKKWIMWCFKVIYNTAEENISIWNSQFFIEYCFYYLLFFSPLLIKTNLFIVLNIKLLLTALEIQSISKDQSIPHCSKKHAFCEVPKETLWLIFFIYLWKLFGMVPNTVTSLQFQTFFNSYFRSWHLSTSSLSFSATLIST